MTRQAVHHEPTAWLRSAVAEKVAQIDAHLRASRVDPQQFGAIVTTLSNTEGQGDRTCDRCSTYVPPGPMFYVDQFEPRPGLHIVIGLCQTCRDIERSEDA